VKGNTKMSGLNRGGEPVVSTGGGIGWWKPTDNKGGRNEVVLLSDIADIPSSPDFVKLFQKSNFGKPAYPATMTWLDTGKDDPRHVLCPNEKLQYTALAWVAYEDNGEWKVGGWLMSKSVHTKLFNAFQDVDLKGKVINVQMVGTTWNVSYVGKKTAPAAALALDVPEPNSEVEKRLLGVYDNSEAVWDELVKRMGVETREEVMEAFGVGADSDTDLL